MSEKICRICLQTISNFNCQAVEEPLLIFLKLNINISKENVVCIECANCLRVFSNFTSGCAYTNDEMLHSSDLNTSVKLEPEAIKTTTNLMSSMKTEIKCSFCTQIHGREDLISLRESKENKFMMNMLERYISETNLKNTEELLTCENCLEALQAGSSVILKCLQVEEKINKYIELKGTDDEGRVELKEVRQFMFGPIIKSEIESSSVDKLEDISDQVQEEYAAMEEGEIKFEKGISNTELIIKSEDIKIEQGDCDITDIKPEQSDYDGFQELPIENKNTSEIKMLQCEFCTYQAKWKSHLEIHLLTHKNPSEIKMFKCELCTYEGKLKKDLIRHLLIHKSPSEINMFKCGLCSYETRRKYHLERHLLTHKDPSKIKMFKCKLCPYEAKLKDHLNTHLLTHKNPSEVKMFKCELCTYEAKLRGHLKRHLLVHNIQKRPSEINVFKCSLCPYEARQEYYLDKHLLTHKNPLKMFKCVFCSYQTNSKTYLTNHLLTHKDPGEIKKFKCEICSFETKYKSALKHHLLIHKNPSEIKMFKCELCTYEAKLKSRLKRHLLIHKSPSEINMFKCELCSYETKEKCHLKRHLIIHKRPS